jgi:hypothetical protein
MTDDEKVRWMYSKFRKALPENRRVPLSEFAQRQARKKLGTACYGDPALYRRWLKKMGIARQRKPR